MKRNQVTGASSSYMVSGAVKSARVRLPGRTNLNWAKLASIIINAHKGGAKVLNYRQLPWLLLCQHFTAGILCIPHWDAIKMTTARKISAFTELSIILLPNTICMSFKMHSRSTHHRCVFKSLVHFCKSFKMICQTVLTQTYVYSAALHCAVPEKWVCFYAISDAVYPSVLRQK